RILVLRQEARAVGNRVDVVRSLEVASQHAEVRDVQQDGTAKILLDSESQIVSARSLIVDVIRVGITWPEGASALQERGDGSVIRDRCKNHRRVRGGWAPLTESVIIEHSDAAANGRLSISKHVVGESKSRSGFDWTLVHKATWIRVVTRDYAAIG